MSDEGPRMLRLVLEVPADGLKDVVDLLARLKHIAYRSDVWLTERDDATSPTSTRSENGGVSERRPQESDREA